MERVLNGRGSEVRCEAAKEEEGAEEDGDECFDRPLTRLRMITTMIHQ